MNNKADKLRYSGYSYKGLTIHGSMQSEAVLKQKILKQFQDTTYIIPQDLSDHFKKNILRISEIAEQRGARLFITWPTTVRNEKFSFENQSIVAKGIGLREKLAEIGVQIYCDPEAFNFDPELFFDTIYHLNTQGAAIRSEKLSQCLRRTLNFPDDLDIVKVEKGEQPNFPSAIIGSIESEISVSGARMSHGQGQSIELQDSSTPASIDKETKEAAIDQASVNPNDKAATSMRFALIRIDDLSRVNYALLQFHQDHGRFPKSVGWDGVYSQWGHQSSEYIKELVPDYSIPCQSTLATANQAVRTTSIDRMGRDTN